MAALLSGCVARRPYAEGISPRAVLDKHVKLMSSSAQVLLVVNEPPPNQRFATAWFFDRKKAPLSYDPANPPSRGYDVITEVHGWDIIRGPIACSVGANGVARPGAKVEGDKMTPSGSYTLTEALGRDPMVNTKLAYRQATDNDAWDERPDSPTYNQWVSGEAAKGLTERLGADSELMRVCIVVDYNRWPAVPGKGSAIFIHRAHPDGAGTLGCIGFEKDDLDWLLATLDPAKKPRVVIVRGQ